MPYFDRLSTFEYVAPEKKNLEGLVWYTEYRRDDISPKVYLFQPNTLLSPVEYSYTLTLDKLIRKGMILFCQFGGIVIPQDRGNLFSPITFCPYSFFEHTKSC